MQANFFQSLGVPCIAKLLKFYIFNDVSYAAMSHTGIRLSDFLFYPGKHSIITVLNRKLSLSALKQVRSNGIET